MTYPEDADLMALIDDYLRVEVQKEFAARFWEEFLGVTAEQQARSLQKLKEGFEGIKQACQGLSVDPKLFASFNNIWRYDERPENFTPAEFERMWDGFSKQRKIDYVLSLIG